MHSDIFLKLEHPPIYQPSDNNFWNDEYISKYMLEAHLNPDFEGASRKLSFIDKSVRWMEYIIPPKGYPRLLDVG